MKSKTIGLLLLVVILPTSLLSWGGYQLARQNSDQQREQIKNLFRDQLSEIDSRVKKYFSEQEAFLQQLTEKGFPTLSDLRDVANSNGIVENLFVINANDTLAYPNPVSPLNQRERDFYSRIKAIVEGGDIQDRVLQATQNTGKTSAPAQQSAQIVDPSSSSRQSVIERTAPGQLITPPGNQSRTSDPEQRRDGDVFLESTNGSTVPDSYEVCSGWFTWYWGRGLNLIYWQRISTGSIICVALDRSRWMSDIIGELPDSFEENLVVDGEDRSSLASKGRSTRILNANSSVVYQWGESASEQELVLAAELPASSPINAWRFQIWVTPAELQGGGAAGFNIFIGILASTIALITMAWIFIREYTKELNEATRRVSFVNQVSHELRTPLTNIRMYAELLSADLNAIEGVDTSKARQRLDVVESESERLTRLIGNVLTFAGSQKNTLKIHPLIGVIDDCIQSVISRFMPSLEKLDLNLRLDLDAAAPVRFDSDALEQILGNLISNIEKYAADGQQVLIQSRQSDHTTEILVQDDGAGIRTQDQEKIFEPFWRESNELQRASGTGIGLSISRELCRLHGGDLTLEDRDSDSCEFDGACFKVRLRTERVD